MIGPATPADAAAVARVELACRRPVESSAPASPPGSSAEQDLCRIWQARLEQDPRSVIVLREETEVVAFAWAGPTRDADQDPNRTASLHAFCISSRAQRTGGAVEFWIATRNLLLAQEYSGLTVWVDAGDLDRREQYEALGFRGDWSVERPSVGGGREVRYRLSLV